MRQPVIDPKIREAAARRDRRRQRTSRIVGMWPAAFAVLVMVVVLPFVFHKAYLQATLGPVEMSDLVPGGTIYHYVGLGNSAYYKELEIVEVNGNQVVTEEFGIFGASRDYHAISDLIDGHRRGLTLYREWAAK